MRRSRSTKTINQLGCVWFLSCEYSDGITANVVSMWFRSFILTDFFPLLVSKVFALHWPQHEAWKKEIDIIERFSALASHELFVRAVFFIYSQRQQTRHNNKSWAREKLCIRLVYLFFWQTVPRVHSSVPKRPAGFIYHPDWLHGYRHSKSTRIAHNTSDLCPHINSCLSPQCRWTFHPTVYFMPDRFCPSATLICTNVDM